ncbi:acyl-CoA synthetase [Streptomyces nojiriensis]|uniref:Acyl-CoA synthetase n=1 Tax=Streptomyces nojiriensis TaxID=66374 RepID=A0ABQ3SHT1_9ACTN|nr:class I adenylate-forming enzyme family protein [Streptomyces nojiriensis]QTI49251.1 2-succinylbenzoate--CoA ligase [Streptomyces nojiriensis]GGS10285.1 acyl-CoA synthetase [Streptomyces nojiriensis]GHI67624.1 acyl-CoA synthetase [Streptomyces nojiriensis]
MTGSTPHAVPGDDHRRAHAWAGREYADRLPLWPTVPELLAQRAHRAGAHPYLTFCGADGAVTTVTYGDTFALSRRLASWARRELSAGPGDVFALAPTNELRSVAAVFGLLLAGCSVLSVNPGDPAGRILRQAEALGARAVLRAPDTPADELVPWTLLPDPRQLPETDDTWTGGALDPAADALYFSTSGSTAASKLVAQSHYNGAVNAEALRRHHGLGPGDRFLGCLPIHHVNGLHFSIFGVLASGAHGILLSGFDPFAYAALLTEYQVRVASVVPSILETLVETWRAPRLPPRFEYFVSAAAPLAQSTARAVCDRWGVRVLQGYGLTETTNFSTTMPRGLSEAGYRALALDSDIPSVGTALYGNEVAVIRADGRRAEPGETGEICMRGHNVMSRYQGNPVATAQAFAGGWFHSQDLGHEIREPETGLRFVVITGRAKNIAKVRGETVSLEEMERALRALPSVRDAACAAAPDRFLGEVVIAGVVAPGETTDTVLLDHLRRFFDPAVLPVRWVRMVAIPRTATGKIIRPKLRELLAEPADRTGAEGESNAGMHAQLDEFDEI